MALVVKNPPANAGVRDRGSIPGVGGSAGGHSSPLHRLAWRIPMDKGTWQATFERVAKSRTRPKRLSTHTQVLKYQETLLVFEK